MTGFIDTYAVVLFIVAAMALVIASGVELSVMRRRYGRQVAAIQDSARAEVAQADKRVQEALDYGVRLLADNASLREANAELRAAMSPLVYRAWPDITATQWFGQIGADDQAEKVAA